MEHDEITTRPGCEVLAVLFGGGFFDKSSKWDRGYIMGAVFALWAGHLITEEEHDAVLVLLGVGG